MSTLKGCRLLFVAIGEADRASSRLRVHAWKPILEEAGVTVEVLSYHDVAGGQGTGWLRRRSPRLSSALAAPGLWRRIADRAPEVDWVIFQEVLPPGRLLEQLRRTGTRVGFDFSDPIHLANAPEQGMRHRLVHALTAVPRFRRLVGAAEWCLIENDLLEDLVRSLGGAPVIMRGPVDTDMYRPIDRAGRSRPVLGWTGSKMTLPLMRPLLGILEQLALEGLDFELRIFGVSGSVEVENVPTTVHPWDLAQEPIVVGQFDVALNYMPMTPWTRHRGGAKLIFYQACGVPTVSSPSGIGDQVVVPEETGFVVSTSSEWKQALRRLVADRDLRDRLGAQARRVAVSKHSYRAYLSLIEDLLV